MLSNHSKRTLQQKLVKSNVEKRVKINESVTEILLAFTM